MLADEVAAVHEMARRQRVFRSKLDVATVAVACSPLILVLVATEADRHLGPQRFGLLHADLDVAAHTIPLRLRHVGAVLELEVDTRELGAAAHVRFAMTAVASARVMRRLVTRHAIRRLRKMKRPFVSRFGDSLVARETSHALEDVGAMFERMGRFPAQAEYPRARRDEQRQYEQKGQARAHGKVRATLRRPFTSNR